MTPLAVGRWQVESVLGRGRLSTVYLARGAGGERVALKVSPGTRASYAGEFALARTLRRAVQPVEQGTDGPHAFLAMEFAPGGTLARRGPLPPGEAAACVTQVAGALAVLHSAGWVHRDVKPANLLLRGDGSVALGDFGCACAVGEQPQVPTGTVIGTPAYAAPEQSAGAPAHPAADVYSLGATFFELLCGRPPFTGETAAELLGQHLLAPVPRLPDALARWQPLVDAMLAKQPDERPRDGVAVLIALGMQT